MMNCQHTIGIAIPPIISRKPGLLSSVVSLTGTLERLDDAALMQRIGTGDHRAYGVLVRRCLPKLLSVARRYTGNATEAEDIVQEALTRLWIKAPTWDREWNQEKAGRASITTWLYRIVVNLCIDRHRRVQPTGLEQIAEPADDRPDAQARLEQRATSQKVRAAIDALPERQRMVLVLYFFEGMSNAEAAALMDIGVGAIESLLVRARRQLRETLGDFARTEWGITGGKP